MANHNRYQALILAVFRSHYKKGITEFEFAREEIETFAQELDIKLPKNLGDLIYSFRYRAALPTEIVATAPEGLEWTIDGAGKALYRFLLGPVNRIAPREDLMAIKIPDSTPEIIRANRLDDEQALLALVRYNRLIDIFLGITAYSLQNHLRTTVAEMGQIEIDELYTGVSRSGTQYVVPVQAKGGKDKHGATQTKQDIACCREKFPLLVCRPISAQFMADDTIAMFELGLDAGQVRVIEEKHYKLVLASEVTEEDLRRYTNP
jgi:hypothetical protein